jgi:hypothetical protein
MEWPPSDFLDWDFAMARRRHGALRQAHPGLSPLRAPHKLDRPMCPLSDHQTMSNEGESWMRTTVISSAHGKMDIRFLKY